MRCQNSSSLTGRDVLRWALPLVGLAATVGCGLSPTGLPDLKRAGAPRVADFPTVKAFRTPDYQKTLVLGPKGKPTGSWYDVKGQAGPQNQDALEVSALSGPSGAAFYDYLTQHRGPVAVYAGGLGDEASPWNPPFTAYPGVPSLALNYSLDRYSLLAGDDLKFWLPWGRSWQTSTLPFDDVAGLPQYDESVRYGAALLDRLMNKLEAAGASEVWVFGHSKGADVASRAVYDRGLHTDHRQDAKLTRVWTFAMPVIAPHTPASFGFHSHSPHWGGFFKAWGGKLLIYNRESDFVTYGDWPAIATHDYGNLVQDSPLAPFPHKRGQSPAWSPTENFMARYQAFAASSATSDQSPATLSYDW